MSHQDLREECIKLKMLVFDLERQNRALCELFQQKLPNQPAAHYQVPHLSPPSATILQFDDTVLSSVRRATSCSRALLLVVPDDIITSPDSGPGRAPP